MKDEQQIQDQASGEAAEAQNDGSKMPAEQEEGEPTRSRPTFRPRVDILETEAGLTLIADVPGAARDGIEVSLERRELTFRARVENDAPEGMTPLLREYEVGDFERRFTLTGDFDTDAIEADRRDGVLALTIPKAREVQARRIELKAG